MRVTLDLLEDAVFPRVDKPNRYIGNFYNLGRTPAPEDLRVLLLAPEPLEDGLARPGLQQLYRLLAARRGVAVELCFAPAADLEAELLAHDLPWHSLETRTSGAEFDLVLFYLGRELLQLEVPRALFRLGLGAADSAARRAEVAVLAAGPGALNPLPLAGLIDAVLGPDAGPEALSSMLALAARARAGAPEAAAEAAPDGVPRAAPEVAPGAAPSAVEVAPGAAPEGAPLVAFTELSSDRLSVTLTRGCWPDCPACRTGSSHAMPRPRAVADVVDEVARGLERTGLEEVRLLLPAGAVYPQLEPLLEALERGLLGRPYGLAIEGLTGGELTARAAEILSHHRAGTLAFAPLAGTADLRRRLGVRLEDEDLLAGVRLARRHGWHSVRLDFCVGVPGETREDLDSLAALVRLAHAAGRTEMISGGAVGKGGGGGAFQLLVSLLPWVPRPRTALERAAALDAGELAARMSYVKGRAARNGVQVRARDAEAAEVEAMLARGGAELARALSIYGTEHFDPAESPPGLARWKAALRRAGVDPERGLRGYSADEPLPWADDGGATAFPPRVGDTTGSTPRHGAATPAVGATGAASASSASAAIEGSIAGVACVSLSMGMAGLFGRKPRRGAARGGGAAWQRGLRFRVEYTKDERVRFTSHLEVMRALERAMRRAGLPLACSRGHNPRPRVASGPPLPLGFTSRAEYLDLEFTRSVDEGFLDDLNTCLNTGLEGREAAVLTGREESLSACIDTATWRAWLTPYILAGLGRDADSVVAHWNLALHDLAQAREPVLWPAKATPDAKRVDARGMVRAAVAERRGDAPEIRFETPITGGLRPEQFVARLSGFSELDPRLVRVERAGLWVTKGTRRLTPLMAIASPAGALAAATDWV